ncbi:hypothetical protein PHYBLDRAFT_71490 [Phycomyces blakesleeanus NRRL 1555(-)]|uniref:Uncharacterized protein n=1 Tax=Phycomyces blakesleeanus (strain ATCC 8743b / DSM 1359 / FGSC 10004 / NBRC 33097 / NRRL 1555) TaxID=763407 RepID=A0A163AL48_PHYB8|nr:hypothetical protein PHYBLDRAFT_71490 [Phycomyces blakesleeanus NRRL 1555(-)]OAD74241.1 hypothetical protein PHYBLDRAFT_71490 [Phycomyces blakesleeanus NRRL 1555(-)]|eukprot:XP_018292281.1 hypothetical protein PHYBLDRAFT_71490 [Phycomyces blakesleeanus NRRL 1555(-)]
MSNNNTAERLGSLESSVKELTERMDICEQKIDDLASGFDNMKVSDPHSGVYPTPKRINGRDQRFDTIKDIIQKESKISAVQAELRLENFVPVVHELLRTYIQKIRNTRARIPLRWSDVSDDDKERIYHLIEEGANEHNITLNLCEKSWGARCLAQPQWVKARNAVFSMGSGNSKTSK